ncbi:putative sequence-specific DNA binding protein [Thozetella sp. PMI_491]|nr:putative sequence-specific DNA binding protein [Thozetella sp. PMI_491]
MASPLIDPALFEQLKAKIEEDAKVRQELHDIVEELSQQVAYVQGLLSRIHSTPRSQYPTFLKQVDESISKYGATVTKLSTFASGHPYYKHNFKWTRTVQDAISTVLLSTWLGGGPSPQSLGRLLSLEEVGEFFSVPVNLKDEDAFHITIEEYLFALINIIDELSRLAMNSVTLGDTAMAVQISTFIKDLHAGFQMLNLKNDLLRKRVDSVKYAVKKVEDVVYDLSLRNLIPSKSGE